MTIKMAPQNELSSYFFQIITQENYPRKSIIFDVPLQTHVSLWDKEQGTVVYTIPGKAMPSACLFCDGLLLA